MGRDSAQLVNELSEMGIPRGSVLDAVRYVPRPAFVPKELRKHAWENRPLSIGEGQTISQPFTVARMLELVELDSGNRVLEIGGGSGYAAALIAYVVGDLGSVTTMEIRASLAVKTAETLRSIGLASVQVIHGNGKRGHPPRAPYDAIVVSAQAPEVPPALIDQLADGGRIVIPIEQDGTAVMTCVRREGEHVRYRHFGRYAFVPLIGEG